VKYEEVYLKDYLDVGAARQELGRYFTFYNTQRFHQALALIPTRGTRANICPVGRR